MFKKSSILPQIVIAFLVAASQCAAAVQGAVPADLIKTTISDPELSYDVRAVALSSPDAAMQLILSTRPKGDGQQAESLAWASIDPAGKISSRQDLTLAFSASESSVMRTHITAPGNTFAITNAGEAVMMLPAPNGSGRLVRWAGNNNSGIGQTVNFGGRTPLLTRLIATAKGHLLALGALGIQPLVQEIDANGKVITQMLVPEQGATAINALPESNGNVILAEEGTYPDSRVWIGRVSNRGEISDKASFAGRPLDIAAAGDGTYILLVEEMDPKGSTILMKGLKSDLTEKWTRTLMTAQQPVRTFRIAPAGDDGFVVAGTRDRGVWISRFTRDGEPLWTEWHDPRTSPELEMASRVELATAGNTIVVAYTAFVVTGREQHEVVRTIRLKSK